MKWAIFGAGKMTEAIFKALSCNLSKDEFYFYSPTGVSAEKLAKQFNGNTFSISDDLSSFDYIFLGMKPQQFLDFKASIKGKIDSRQTVISVLAAISTKALSQLGTDKIIRLMPNMLIAEKKGLTLMSFQKNDAHITEAFKKSCELIFVTDEELDFYTLFSGCAPAYMYYFLKESEKFSKIHNMDSDKAKIIMWKTFRGMFESYKEPPNDLEEKINSITSKGGVTRAVLDGFEKPHPNFFIEAWNQGLKRIKELKK